MKKLSDNEYWNEMFAFQKPGGQTDGPFTTGKRLKRFVKRLLGERMINILQSYNDYLLWEKFYPKYLPAQKGLKAIEIGSAPGNFMIAVHKRFGYEPYGIEYTKGGAELNRRLFVANKINPNNIFLEDFLSKEFHKQYAGYFDIVFSRGFIEHFDNVDHIIKLHLNLLAPGGSLVVSIPCFKGINHLLMSFFHKENLDIHNLKIMEKENFRKLFKEEYLKAQYLDYFGTFDLSLFNTKSTSFKRHILNACTFLQCGLNGLFWLVLRKRGFESRAFSPFLLFIGKKEEITLNKISSQN